MKGFVLAAGFGTRLRPITDHMPKALVPLCGKPLLERALAFLAEHRITDVGVNAHYRADALQEYRKSSGAGFTLFHERGAIRGTGGGVFFARDFLEGDEYFFVCNVDILLRTDLESVIDKFANRNWVGALLAAPAREKGTIYYRPDTQCYAGVPADGHQPPGTVPADFVGAAIYKKEFLRLLTPGDFSIVPVWKRAVEAGALIGVMVLDDCYWCDIGTPRSLAKAHFDFLDGTYSCDVPGGQVVDRPNRRSYPRRLPEPARSTIGPYSWVEAEEVPEGCTIRNSIVLKGAALAPGCAVNQSIVTAFGEIPCG